MQMITIWYPVKMNSGSYSASVLCTQQMSIRNDSQTDDQNFCCIAIKDIFQRLKNASPRASSSFKLSELERGHIIALKEVDLANWRIAQVSCHSA
ncbi:hypothetical protein TNCV_3703921 [Trichonephila clavipes]|nr:hypothetical protein TNCV_3703921 [Trichonephila clavipes]